MLHERCGSGAAMAHVNPAPGSGRKRGEKAASWPPARSGRLWYDSESGSVGMIRRSGRLAEGGEALEPTPARGPGGLHEVLHPTGRTVEPAAEVLDARDPHLGCPRRRLRRRGTLCARTSPRSDTCALRPRARSLFAHTPASATSPAMPATARGPGRLAFPEGAAMRAGATYSCCHLLLPGCFPPRSPPNGYVDRARYRSTRSLRAVFSEVM